MGQAGVEPQRKFIGVASLTECVSAIAEGKMPFDSVEKLILSTKIEGDEVWNTAIRSRQGMEWKSMPQLCEEITHRLLAEEKIIQPRLDGKPAPNTRVHTGARIWVFSEDQITWQEN